MAEGQQILRTDHESIFCLSDNMEKKLIATAIKAMKSCGAIIISDYAKGVLTDKVLSELIKAAKKKSNPQITLKHTHSTSSPTGDPMKAQALLAASGQGQIGWSAVVQHQTAAHG